MCTVKQYLKKIVFYSLLLLNWNLQATSSFIRQNGLLISTTRNNDRIGNKGRQDLYLTKRFMMKIKETFSSNNC